jgi:hypothetical protein
VTLPELGIEEMLEVKALGNVHTCHPYSWQCPRLLSSSISQIEVARQLQE